MGKMTKAQAGRLGGRATVARYGHAHMKRLAELGARALWSKYRLAPFGQSDFMLILRATDQPTGITINGKHLPTHTTEDTNQ